MATKKNKDPRAADFIERQTQYKGALKRLRSILLDFELEETIKWGKPCYMHEGQNVAVLQVFKDYASVLFTQGALLKDPGGDLVDNGPNSQAAKRMHFVTLKEVKEREEAFRSLVDQAVLARAAGLKVDRKPKAELDYPAELTEKLAADPVLAEAFDKLTPGRRRYYLIHFSEAKQSKTRSARIDKARENILAGRGHNER